VRPARSHTRAAASSISSALSSTHIIAVKRIHLGSYLALLGVAAFSVLSVGCATVGGVGEDVENLGEEIQDESDDARRRR
jgi:predicted small secreted protein